jgi:hypothetical protein
VDFRAAEKEGNVMSDMVTNCFVKRCDEQKQFVDEMKRCNATQAIICALSMAECAHAIRSLGYVQSVGTARCTHSRHTKLFVRTRPTGVVLQETLSVARGHRCGGSDQSGR